MTSKRTNFLGHLGPMALLLVWAILVAAGCTSMSKPDASSSNESSAGTLTKKVGGAPQVAFQDSDIIPIMRSPMMGPMSAKVTIVTFSDFQCPYCRRGAGTLSQIFKTFPEDTKIVFKQLPLSFHPQAEDAARASIAASRQGRFWEMHDWLFENQDAFREHDGDFKEWVAKYAGMLKLDVEKFRKDFDAQETTQIIERDLKLAAELKVEGTPAFFINGERMNGALPFDEFARVVEARRAQAEEKIGEGDVPPNLYASLVAENYQRQLPMIPGPSMKDGEGDLGEPAEEVLRFDTSKLTIHPGQVRGPKDAKVTIFAFEDFECPYCAKADVNLKEALAEVDDSVRVVFKHMPLSFHPQAHPAAKASIAAREQGKFWEMHDLLFERQADLGEPGIYEKLAKSLGLDMKKFKADMASDKYDAEIKADTAQAQALGFQGTPTFIIDGTAVVGAQPADSFVRVIREALAEKQ